MKTLLNKFKTLLKLKKAKRKEVLPQGMIEFYRWSNDILSLYDLPNNDSTKFALATMILHSKEDASSLSKEYFGIRLRKAAANQIAAGIMQQLKEKQTAAIEAAKTGTIEQK